MKKLGISIYSGHTSLKDNLDYMELAAKYGFKRIFTCLISLENKTIENTIKEFKEITSLANKLDMEVIADIDPDVFKRFGVSIQNLYFFKDLGVSGIRLDIGFSGIEESIMSCNTYGIKIEFNMSGGTKYIENILSCKPNKENILGCHNFYPRLYTGLSLDHFIECSKQYKELGIRTAAFVSSSSAKYGPWPVSEGLCTLEMHRFMPIEVQVKHMYATELIDDVIIANSFAVEDELKKISRLNKDMLQFSVELEENIPEIERRIVLEENHFNRGDVSDYVIRSTQSRIKYKGHEFPVFNPTEIKRGDILIDSSLYSRYAGELQVALKNMKNTGKTNVVGRISEEELFLLDYIRPWSKFCFTANKV
jgi:uncharacterized protein